MRRTYKTKILAGPGPSQSLNGKSFLDRIRETEEWFGRHMELCCAAMGGRQNVVMMAQQYGQGRFDPSWLKGKQYIALIAVNGSFNNVNVRVPNTTQNWAAVCAGQDPVDNGHGEAPAAGLPPGAPPPGGMMQGAGMPTSPNMAPPVGAFPGQQPGFPPQATYPGMAAQPPMPPQGQYPQQQPYPPQGQAPGFGGMPGLPGGMPNLPGGMAPGPSVPPGPVPGQGR
jgi:hypothetical protein